MAACPFTFAGHGCQRDTTPTAAVCPAWRTLIRRTRSGAWSETGSAGIVAATIWYLIVCSILMVGQSRLERYYGRGFGAMPKKTKQKITEIGADH